MANPKSWRQIRRARNRILSVRRSEKMKLSYNNWKNKVKKSRVNTVAQGSVIMKT